MDSLGEEQELEIEEEVPESDESLTVTYGAKKADGVELEKQKFDLFMKHNMDVMAEQIRER